MNQKTINGGAMNGEAPIHKVKGGSSSPIRLQMGDFTRMSQSISRSLSHRPTGPKGRGVVISHWLNVCQA
jgi:hypothetical protein